MAEKKYVSIQKIPSKNKWREIIQTAPFVIRENVAKVILKGYTKDIREAISNERKNEENVGVSSNGSIKVIRIGAVSRDT